MNYASIEKTIKLIEKEIKEAKLPYIRQELEKLLTKIKRIKPPHLPQEMTKTLKNNFMEICHPCPECGGDGKVLCYNDEGQLLLDKNGDPLEEKCKRCRGLRYVIELRKVCPKCFGKGELILSGNPFDRNSFYSSPCPHCGGTGIDK